MKAFLFPGQGERVAPLASRWCEEAPAVRRLVERAAEAARVPLAEVLHASGAALRDTAVYQPVAVALCVGVHAELAARGVHAAVVAGHSLGELAACAAAGVCSAEDAVDLAALRGRLMGRAAERHPGGMVAVRAPSRGAALDAAALPTELGRVELAAQNAADRFVLSGPWAALRALPASLAPAPLATGGPWHSSAMAEAVDEFRSALRRACRARPRILLLSNATGAPVGPDDDVAERLARQLTRPVEWHATLATLASQGVTAVVGVGPAKALCRLAERELGAAVSVRCVDSPEGLAAAAALAAA